MEQQFVEMCNSMANLAKEKTLSDAVMLDLYAYYKQATVGDCNTKQPSIFHPRDRKKWESWSELRGISIEIAMKRYNEIALDLLIK